MKDETTARCRRLEDMLRLRIEGFALRVKRTVRANRDLDLSKGIVCDVAVKLRQRGRMLGCLTSDDVGVIGSLELRHKQISLPGSEALRGQDFQLLNSIICLEYGEATMQ